MGEASSPGVAEVRVVIWAILALLGVPLWLCAIGIFVLLFNNHKLRKRPGDIPVRVLRPGKKRWTRGHAVWVSDVFAWRASPAGWNEDVVQISGASVRPANAQERKKLHRLADEPVVASLALAGGTSLAVAALPEDRPALLGPFLNATVTSRPAPESERNGHE